MIRQPGIYHTTLYMEEKDLEQVVLQGLEYEDIEKEKAAERKALTRKYGLKPEDAKYTQDTQGQTRDIVAKKLGISGKHWERMKYIYQHREYLVGKEYENWRIGKLSTSKAYNLISQDIKCNKTLDEMLKILKHMQWDMIEYESSFILTDIQHNLLRALWGCREKTKKEVLENFDKLINFNKDVLDKRYDKICDIELKINDLRKKLRNRNNDI